MKISCNWLKDFVDFDMEPHALQEALTLAGLEVESVIEKRLDYPAVVVGRILSCDRHPNADKLSICTVEVGDSTKLNIICGAPNVQAGQTVPVAKVGAELPNGLTIRKASIRGVESEGMICSEAELGLAEKSEGIWVLPSEISPGIPLAQALNFQTDYVLDVGVTPNRSDALCHLGVAREIAAIVGRPLQIPKPQFVETAENISDVVSVDIECPDSCPRYAARLIRNVTLRPSPDWMARRLQAAGMRPINNIVDISNYIMLETGQPLHAFDFKLLSAGRIVVRESRAGDTFVTLDDKEHILEEGTVMICDAAKPVAIGGIMGGLNSEVNDDTRDILLESAHFHPHSIQKSARYLGINSEAAHRFVRGVDPNGVLHALERATQLIVDLAGGEVCRGAVDNYPKKIHPVSLELKTDQINTLIGLQLTPGEMAVLLEKVALPVVDGTVIVPTFRPDIRRTADIAEEIARLYGYDHIPVSRGMFCSYHNPANPFDDYLDELKNILTGISYQEVITNSMINSKDWAKWSGQRIYPILNPISNDMDGLRNTLVLSLLKVLQWNINRQVRDLSIFEINKVFYHPGDLKQRPREEVHLGIAMTGYRERDTWFSDRQLYDFYDIKGIVEYVADKISLDKFQLIAYDNFAVEQQSLKMVIGGQEAGFLGRVPDSLQKAFDIETPVWVAELNVKLLYQLSRGAKKYHEIPRYPWVERDLAVIVPAFEESEKMLKNIYKNGGNFLKNAYIFDVYGGKQIEAGKKSVAFRLIFQSGDRTLTESEINQSTDNILGSLKKSFAAELREK